MTKRRKRIDPLPGQLSFFDILAAEQESPGLKSPSTGNLNMQAVLRRALNQAIKGCPLSRWQIAGQMSDLLDQEISKYMIDAWTAESKDGHRFPAEYLPAFCQATGCQEPLRILAEAAGLFALPGPEVQRAKIQHHEEKIRKLQQEKKKMQLFLKEMERER